MGRDDITNIDVTYIYNRYGNFGVVFLAIIIFQDICVLQHSRKQDLWFCNYSANLNEKSGSHYPRDNLDSEYSIGNTETIREAH